MLKRRAMIRWLHKTKCQQRKAKTQLMFCPPKVARDLTAQLCGVMHSRSLSPSKLEKILLEKSNISSDLPNYKYELAQFWNLYSEKVVCGSATGEYPDHHFFKRSVAEKVQETVLSNYFLDDENVFPIDVNAIQTYPNGERETLLDFVNHILNTPRLLENYNDIDLKTLRTTMVEYYGAKTAAKIDLERKLQAE